MAESRILVALHTFGQSYMHLPALLARTGLSVDAVAMRGHLLRRSRWLCEVEETDAEEWARVIDRRLASGRYVFFCNFDEPGLLALYRHTWSEAAKPLLPFAPDSAVAATVGSKRAFYRWCETYGLPVPRTHECRDLVEVEGRRGDLSGSWFLKGDQGMGGSSVWPWPEPKRTPPPAEAISSDSAHPWLVQERIDGPVCCALFLAREGRLLEWFAVEKAVALRVGRGPMVLGRGLVDPEIGRLCARVAEASGITALTGFDIMLSPERGPLLIDSHLGRTTTMNHFDSLYGTDIAAALAADLSRRPRAVSAPRPGPDFIKFPEVIQLLQPEDGGMAGLFAKLRKGTRMPLAPADDWRVAFRVTWHVLLCLTRIRAGRARRRLAALFNRGREALMSAPWLLMAAIAPGK